MGKRTTTDKSEAPAFGSDYSTDVLYVAPQMPEHLDIPVLRFYKVDVRPFGQDFRLYVNNCYAGPRHVKGEREELRFPFGFDDWWKGKSFEDMKSRADRLQLYLDTFENPKLPAALDRYKDASNIDL